MFTTGSTAAVQSTGAGLRAGLGRCQARAATSRVLSSLVSHRHASTSAASCASSHRPTQRAAKKSAASGSLFLRREHDLGAGRRLARTFCSSMSRKQQDGRAHPDLQSYQRLRDHQHQQSLPSSPHEHDRIKSVLIVNKLRTKPVVEAIETLLAHIHTKYPGTKVYHEDRPDIPKGVDVWQPGVDALPIDLVVTLGGDGTILHASSLFKKGAVPPVLSFSMGTLGFLLPFHIDDFAPALESAFTGKATVLYRMRLSCTFHDSDGNRIGKANDEWQVMNEIALHRGREPHLSTIDTFVDGQHLTESVGDGLIVSTPTGSTAYSLSAGGPIVHPSLSAMVLTPICPRSLSFRPLVFPSSSSITLRIGERSRAPAGVSMDGQEARVLAPGESVTVRASPYPIPCINRSSIAAESAYGRGEEGAGPGAEDDWVRDINNLLQYNATFRSKALLRYSRP